MYYDDDEMMTPDEFIDRVVAQCGLHSDAADLVQRIVYAAWGLGVNDHYKREFVHDILDDYEGISPDLIEAIDF